MSTSPLTSTNSNTSTTAVKTASANLSNPYDLSSLYGTSMANDYFGSQIFGKGGVYNNTVNTTTSSTVPNAQDTAALNVQDIYGQPDNVASALLQSYITALEAQNTSAAQPQITAQPQTAAQTQVTGNIQNNTTVPTMQDYIIGTQIANLYANDIPLISQNTPYMQNDYFAQQALSAKSYLA